MPTVLIYQGFRFFFYSNEHLPIHIHIEKDFKTAKYNISPIILVKNRGFDSKELKIIRLIIEENEELIKKSWNAYFNHK